MLPSMVVSAPPRTAPQWPLRPRGKTIVRAADKITAAKPSTINRELAVLLHLLNKAVEWGWMDRRPAKTNRFSEGHGQITYLTVDQVTRLVECAKADGNTQIYPFIVIGLETAMRNSEILSIRREDIDLQPRVAFIPKAKAGAREQPITEPWSNFWRPTPPRCNRATRGCSRQQA